MIGADRMHILKRIIDKSIFITFKYEMKIKIKISFTSYALNAQLKKLEF